MADPIEVAGWVLGAGWTGTDAVTATAIALRTGGNTTRPDGVWGIGSAGDGPTQAKAAHAAWAGRGRDWSVFPAFRDRSYLLFIPPAGLAVTAAAAKAAGADVGAKVGGAVDDAKSAAAGIGDLATSVGEVTGFLTAPGAWDRIVKVGLGVVVISIGMAYLWKSAVLDRAVGAVKAIGGDVAKGDDSMINFATSRWKGWTRGGVNLGKKQVIKPKVSTPKPATSSAPKPAPSSAPAKNSSSAKPAPKKADVSPGWTSMGGKPKENDDPGSSPHPRGPRLRPLGNTTFKLTDRKKSK